MSLTPQEIEVVKKLKQEGKTTSQIMGFIGGSRTGRPSTLSIESPEKKQTSNFLKDAWQTYKNVGQTLYSAGESVVGHYQDSLSGKRNPVLAGFDIAGDVAGGVSRAAGDVIMGAGKMLLPKSAEDKIAEKVQGVVAPIAQSPEVQALVEKYQNLDENTKQNYRTAGNLGMALVDILTLKGASKVAEKGADIIAETAPKIKSIFPDGGGGNTFEEVVDFAVKRQPKVVDGAIDTTTKTARQIAEETAPKVSIKEELLGLDAATKRQLQGATKETKEAIDVAIAHNLDSNNPSLMEYLGDNARKAAQEMETMLNDTGSHIGQTRQKLATYEAAIDDVKEIEQVFRKEAAKLNLDITPDGRFVQKPGTVAKITSQGDIKSLQTMWKEMSTVKESPTVTNMLDFRNLVQSNIKFGKTAREISDMLDPISRNIRKVTADKLAKVVGKTEAGRLKEYTDFIDAFNDIKSFTDRRAGGEYLLRSVMSGTGGEARTVINTIRNFTGRDLMTDATLLGVVTELFGNKTQKTLLTQAMENAGYSSVRMLKGDPTAAIPSLAKWLKERLIDPEKVLLESTKGFKAGATPSSGKIVGESVIPKTVPQKVPKTQKLSTERNFESFMKNQKVFSHQTNAKFDDFDVKFANKKDPAIWFFNGEAPANSSYKYTVNRYPNKDIKLIPESKLDKWMDKSPSDMEFYKYLESQGFDGINYGDSVQIFNPQKSLKSVEQLRDAYMGFERAKGLTKEGTKIENAAFNKIAQKEDALIKEYLSNPKLSGENGKIINTDNFRPLFKEEGYKGFNAADVQEPSSYLAKKAYTKLLKENPEKYVVGTGGGSGVGKSSALKNIEEYTKAVNDAALILDSNMSSYGSAAKKIKEAIDNGKEFTEFYVYRDPLDSFVNGVIKRMIKNTDEGGRLVPAKVVADNHIKAWEVAKKLDDEGVTVHYVDNSLGAGKAKIVTREELEKKIKYPSVEELTDKLKQNAKEQYKAGVITKEQYEGYIQ